MADLNIDSFSRKYIHRRLASEGVCFLTVELPKVSKAILASLEIGWFDRTTLTSFKYKGSILRLFEELLSRVFCISTGKVLADACPMAIKSIRQVTEYLYKLALEFTDEQEQIAQASFIKNEEELAEIAQDPEVLEFANQLRKDFETYYKEISKVHASDILAACRPRHTNGTFVNGTSHYYFERLSVGSSVCLPSMAGHKGYLKPYPSARVKVETKASPDYSELLLVPKDSRGPRTICREDRVRLETQMSYFDFMIHHLNKESEGAINFLDQTINQRIAEESSVSRNYCTLDLKDASDRVSHGVVKTIFRNSPGCYFFVTGDRRANHVKVGERTYKLRKLAGMGSGLTFPTMSLLISLAICNKVRKRYPHIRYADIRRNVFVYGDDICCPSDWYQCAVDALALIGLKVNVSKSFVRSHFRESCGGDYYRGIDVTPTRLRLSNSKPKNVGNFLVELPNSPNAFKQLYEHSKECYGKGLKKLSSYYMSILHRTHVQLFGFRMVAGRFDKDLDLFVDYTKGTSHLPIGVFADVLSVVPDRHRSSKMLVNGRLLERCPYKYLSSSFNREANDPLDPKAPTSFEEVTKPRVLCFAKQRVSTDFILPVDLSFSREHFEDQLRREQLLNILSQAIVWNVFDAVAYQA